MKPSHALLLSLFAVLALPMVAAGQNNTASTTNASDDAAIEKFAAAGQKSAAELRREYWQSEEDFYSLFSKLNDDNLYDVRCIHEAPIGSRIKNQVCRPVFLTRALNRGEISSVTNLDTDPVIADKMAKFRKKLDTLISANPELQAAAVKYGTARAQYMALSERRDKN